MRTVRALVRDMVVFPQPKEEREKLLGRTPHYSEIHDKLTDEIWSRHDAQRKNQSYS